ncbi:hypothetical protein H6770_02930 [Candidatus Peribacteria bacterium]|nr:hypothetical protein [Candidatus Peribacteria bacterium]
MRQIHATVLTFALTLAIPSAVFAAFNTPEEALGATRNTGIPREFSAEAHNRDGDIFLSSWITGVQEGTGNWLKLRMDVTTHMKQPHDFVSLNMRVLVYQNTLYYTITGANLHAENPIIKTQLNSMLKKWVALPLPTSIDIGSAWNMVDILEAIDMDILQISDAWNDVRTSADTLSLEHTKYTGGNAYSIASTMPNHNLHIRLNTTEDGVLQFGKYYLSRGAFVFQGTMHPYGSTVNLDIPKETITPTEFELSLLGFEFPMMYGNIPLPITPLPEEHYREPREALLKTPEPEIPESRNYVEFIKRSGQSQEEPITCAWPGTLDSIELGRKGVCPSEKLDKRDIRQLNAISLTGMERREQRFAEDRTIENYDTVAEKFEGFAKRRDAHRLKTMLSRASITSIGSDGIDAWLNQEVIPFFTPMMRSSIVEYMLIEDDKDNEGIALHKMVVTETGRRKDMVIVLFHPDEFSEPVIMDIFFNTTLRQLTMQGIIE